MRVTEIVDVASEFDARLQATLRLERDAMVSRHLQPKKNASTVPSSASQEIPEDGGAADPTPAPRKKWNTKLMHPTWHLLADICPKCDFPEACGGYCPECGWSLPHPFKK